MKLIVKTAKFQEMITKALKGASNNKIFPITSLMEIRLRENVLSITTTDGQNYLRVSQADVPGENFQVTVGIDLFSKLVLKTTTESISMEINDKALKITGNGSYDIELPLDENGDLITYPYPTITAAMKFETTLPIMTIKGIINSNAASLAQTLEVPALTAYYLDPKKAVTSDSFVVAVNSIPTFAEALLISPALMKLLDLVSETEMKVRVYEDNSLTVTSANLSITGKTMEEINSYPIGSIETFIDLEFESKCVVNRANLMNVLDRMGLFVESYDENGIYLNFSETGLIVANKKNNASEKISYQGDKSGIKPFVVLIDLQKLQAQLASQLEEMVTIHYGSTAAIKLVSSKLSHIISLLGDEA